MYPKQDTYRYVGTQSNVPIEVFYFGNIYKFI